MQHVLGHFSLSWSITLTTLYHARIKYKEVEYVATGHGGNKDKTQGGRPSPLYLQRTVHSQGQQSSNQMYYRRANVITLILPNCCWGNHLTYNILSRVSILGRETQKIQDWPLASTLLLSLKNTVASCTDKPQQIEVVRVSSWTGGTDNIQVISICQAEDLT